MATATSKLQIIVDVVGDKAERGLQGIKGSLTQIAKPNEQHVDVQLDKVGNSETEIGFMLQ